MSDSHYQFAQATQADLEAIVMMMADDELGKLREDDTLPLKESYQKALASYCLNI